MNDFKLLYSRHLSTELRSETLERLVSTEALSPAKLWPSYWVVDFEALKKPKAIAFGNCGKMNDFRGVSDCHETYIERQDSISRTRFQVRFV
jgi:hypothetical protein